MTNPTKILRKGGSKSGGSLTLDLSVFRSPVTKSKKKWEVRMSKRAAKFRETADRMIKIAIISLLLLGFICKKICQHPGAKLTLLFPPQTLSYRSCRGCPLSPDVVPAQVDPPFWIARSSAKISSVLNQRQSSNHGVSINLSSDRKAT